MFCSKRQMISCNQIEYSAIILNVLDRSVYPYHECNQSWSTRSVTHQWGESNALLTRALIHQLPHKHTLKTWYTLPSTFSSLYQRDCVYSVCVTPSAQSVIYIYIGWSLLSLFHLLHWRPYCPVPVGCLLHWLPCYTHFRVPARLFARYFRLGIIIELN